MIRLPDPAGGSRGMHAMNATTGRGRRLPPFVLLVAAALAVPATGAFAAPQPDAAALDRLRAAAAAGHRYRVTTQRGQFVVGALRADENGVALTVPEGRPALFVTEGATSGGRRATWAEIERIDGMHTQGARDFVIGAVIGTAIGFALKQAVEPGLHDAADVSIVLVPIGTVVGGGIGLLVGNMHGWHVLYP